MSNTPHDPEPARITALDDADAEHDPAQPSPPARPSTLGPSTFGSPSFASPSFASPSFAPPAPPEPPTPTPLAPTTSFGPATPPAAPAPAPAAPPKVADPVSPGVVHVRTPAWVTPLVLLAGLALFVGGGLAGWAIADRDADGTGPIATTPTFEAVDGGEEGLVPTNAEEPVAAVAQAVAPSVVQINTDFGLGSGIVMDDEGHILTAAHVIEGATQLRVRLPDGTMVPATIVGTHPESDVGVVSVGPRDDLVPAVLGVDADIQVGQLAVAVGSPFGLEQTVTSGIVSALDRPVETEGSLLVGMIQTDASINPGNSGGALADRHGRVIGINDAIRTQGGGNEGVGFAIPIDLAFSVAERLIAGDPIQSGFLGVSANNPIEGRPGALVQEVTPGTPAADAGIQIGDLIVSLDGHPVRGIRELRARILAIDPGTPIMLELVRDDDVIELEVVLTINRQ